MRDDQAFLAAIKAEPQDDAPPLVYADWLDERGDLRGEYLRHLLILDSPASFDRWPSSFEGLRALQPEVDADWSLEVGESVLRRRRPLWAGLSELFIDCEVAYLYVAGAVRDSGYPPQMVQRVLWEEVFPALECNLRHPAGEWISWPPAAMQKILLGPTGRSAPADQPGVARAIGEMWTIVTESLEAEFRICGEPVTGASNEDAEKETVLARKSWPMVAWLRARLGKSPPGHGETRAVR